MSTSSAVIHTYNIRGWMTGIRGFIKEWDISRPNRGVKELVERVEIDYRAGLFYGRAITAGGTMVYRQMRTAISINWAIWWRTAIIKPKRIKAGQLITVVGMTIHFRVIHALPHMRNLLSVYVLIMMLLEEPLCFYKRHLGELRLCRYYWKYLDIGIWEVALDIGERKKRKLDWTKVCHFPRKQKQKGDNRQQCSTCSYWMNLLQGIRALQWLKVLRFNINMQRNFWKLQTLGDGIIANWRWRKDGLG